MLCISGISRIQNVTQCDFNGAFRRFAQGAFWIFGCSYDQLLFRKTRTGTSGLAIFYLSPNVLTQSVSALLVETLMTALIFRYFMVMALNKLKIMFVVSRGCFLNAESFFSIFVILIREATGWSSPLKKFLKSPCGKMCGVFTVNRVVLRHKVKFWTYYETN